MITVKQSLSLTELKRIPCIRPEGAGCHWQGNPHHELVGEIIATAETLDYQIVETTIVTNTDHSEMVASFTLSNPRLTTDYGPMSVAVSTSNNRRKATSFHHGIIAGEIGVPLGLYPIRARHTTRTFSERNVFQIIRDLLKRLPGIVKHYPSTIMRLIRKSLTQEEIQQHLISMGREKIIPWSRIGLADRIIGTGSSSAWATLLALCNVTRLNPPLTQLWSMQKFLDMLTQHDNKKINV